MMGSKISCFVLFLPQYTEQIPPRDKKKFFLKLWCKNVYLVGWRGGDMSIPSLTQAGKLIQYLGGGLLTPIVHMWLEDTKASNPRVYDVSASKCLK